MKKFLITSLLLLSVFFAVVFVFLSLDSKLARKIESFIFDTNSNIESNLKEQNENSGETESGFAKYFSDVQTGVYIVKIPSVNSIEYFDTSENPSSLEEISKSNNFRIGINAGFFTEERTHAGLLFLDGKQVNGYTPNNQLTEVLGISDSKISIVDIESLDLDEDNSTIYFQTGPSVLENSQLQTTKIQNSINGNSNSRRSFIGYDTEGSIYVGFTTKGMSLVSLGNYLLNNNFYEGELTIVNLDGGSSVSGFSSEEASFNFGVSKNLPFYILID